MLKIILFVVFSFLVVSTQCATEISYTGPRYAEEGSTFNISCQLSAGLSLKWTKDYMKLNGQEYEQIMEHLNETYQVSRLFVHNATANHSGHYRCYTFSHVNHTVSVMLDIEDRSHTVELLIDADTFLQCNLSHDITVNITWSKNGVLIDYSDGKFNRAENNTLVITKGAYPDAGTYVCSVTGDASRNITFHLKTRIRAEKFDKSINAVQSDRLVLTCKAISNPPPTVTWYKDNMIISETNNATQHIKLQDANNLTDSQLVIEELVDNDRAVYRCHAINDINDVNITIMVRVKDKLAALWPFLGILAEVAVLCTIIFIYEKRRAKQEYDESDTDPNNESNKQSAEQKKEDVRQRK